jgi:hypothetical protein
MSKLITLGRLYALYALGCLSLSWADVLKIFERFVRMTASAIILRSIERMARHGKPFNPGRLYRMEEFLLLRTHAAHYRAIRVGFDWIGQSRAMASRSAPSELKPATGNRPPPVEAS